MPLPLMLALTPSISTFLWLIRVSGLSSSSSSSVSLVLSSVFVFHSSPLSPLSSLDFLLFSAYLFLSSFLFRWVVKWGRSAERSLLESGSMASSSFFSTSLLLSHCSHLLHLSLSLFPPSFSSVFILLKFSRSFVTFWLAHLVPLFTLSSSSSSDFFCLFIS